MNYIASISFGADSLAMLLELIERREEYPLDEVIFYDTGMEFQAIYDTRDSILPVLKEHGIKYTELHHVRHFSYDMFEKPVKKRGANIIHKKGYGWCGGVCRWGTAQKIQALDKYAESQKAYVYVGIAADEVKRLNKKRKPYKLFPLATWGYTEKDCLKTCYDNGFFYEENGIKLYDILDRVSCWCCRNKNLKELQNIFLYLPRYWNGLKDIQAQLEDPMKGHGKSVFELEERFLKVKPDKKKEAG